VFDDTTSRRAEDIFDNGSSSRSRVLGTLVEQCCRSGPGEEFLDGIGGPGHAYGWYSNEAVEAPWRRSRSDRKIWE
jgi:hypothetical protein